jgi:hypothetical protein
VECGVWIKISAQVGLSTKACCHYKFATHQTTIFLVIYGKLYHGGVLILLNKNAGLQFHLAECIPPAQYLHGQKEITFVLHQTWHAFLGRWDKCCLGSES